jgi:crotonobetainyl-CoA:carnitine CoA-transferase CaiB-like acyl-CoA transferase
MDPVPALGEHTEAIRAEFGLPFTSPLDRNDESTSGK